MRITSTVLPPSDPEAVSRASVHPALKPLCPVRMRAAEAAEAEVAALCEELSQVLRKPVAKAPKASRGVTNRPSVRRRPVRKVPA